MFNPADRPGHLARWIADATRDTEGHEIEKCPYPCSYCADRVAVEQFEEMVEALETLLKNTSNPNWQLAVDALKAVQGE